MEITLIELQDLLNNSQKNTASEFPYPIGTKLIIRTVTMITTGRLTWIGDQELILEDACWIAETDRYADFLSSGKIKECEPYPSKAGIGRGSIVDFAEWLHDLPRTQK